MEKKCANPECGIVINGRSDKRFCSNRCKRRAQTIKEKAEREALKLNNMEGLSGTSMKPGSDPGSGGTNLSVIPNQDDIDPNNPLPGVMRGLKAAKQQAELTAYQLQQQLSAANEKLIDEQRKNDKLEGQIERLKDNHQHSIERLEDKFERELADSKDANGLAGIAKSAVTPEVVQTFIGSLPGILQGLKGTPSNQTLPEGISKDAENLLGWYQGLTPDFKQSFDAFVMFIHNSGMQGAQLLNQFLNQHGTQPQEASAK